MGKQPFAYYGGKQTMIKEILPLIPSHLSYVEPFAGGATVFWNKEPCPLETLNDLNGLIYNLYYVLKRYPERFAKRIQAVMHSKALLDYSYDICKNPYLVGKFERAVATWTTLSLARNNILSSGFSYSKSVLEHGKDININTRALAIRNRKQWFLDNIDFIAKRLSLVTLQNMDSVKCIQLYDTEKTFFYVDPPYINACQGHYTGYAESDFKNLLDALVAIKGKFMLSCYRGDLVEGYVKDYGLELQSFIKSNSAVNTKSCQKNDKKREELLIMNYKKSGLF